MKLVRFGAAGAEKPGAIDRDGQIRDLSGTLEDISGAALTEVELDRLRQLELESLPVVDDASRLGPCVGRPGKIVGVGLNYSDHAAEANMTPPTEPILFMKATSSLSGPYDPVKLPPGSERTDWEVELGAVIGEPAAYVDEATALRHVAGYCIVNDISERTHQLERGGQWMKGKSADTFAPVGPWLVTADEVLDPQALDLWLEVNGDRLQSSSTSRMIFSVEQLISYISQFMTLLPGDIIATGTPAGVGLGLQPPRFLTEGDTMRLEIAGLGHQEQRVVASAL
jgi:ureidoglycolate lyase/2,4-diketo-3-deoxy-L-fuconate hydrolase